MKIKIQQQEVYPWYVAEVPSKCDLEEAKNLGERWAYFQIAEVSDDEWEEIQRMYAAVEKFQDRLADLECQANTERKRLYDMQPKKPRKRHRLRGRKPARATEEPESPQKPD